MKRTSTRLADGRELIYYDSGDDTARGTPIDVRPLQTVVTNSQLRRDPLLDEVVTIAAHRQGRTYHPPRGECPLCPSRNGRHTEIPADDYEVAVFENRFPSLGGPAGGRCEVVCFTADHEASFADLDVDRVALVIEAWTDRTAELASMPGVAQVYPFENRGAEIGVTLGHPHGQLYAFPYLTPRTDRLAQVAAQHRAATGGNLLDDVLAAERVDSRVVLAGEHWTAYVPAAARWPYQVRMQPHQRVPDFPALGDAARAELPALYLELVRRFDALFDAPDTPYIAAWHQAPTAATGVRAELGLLLELFTIRRSADKLKYLAGTESGMGAFMNDISPEWAAQRLREVAVRSSLR